MSARRSRRPARLFTIGGYDYVVPNPRRLGAAAIVVLAVVIAAFMFWPRSSAQDVFASPAGAPCYSGCGTSAAAAYPRFLASGSPEEAAFREATRGATSEGAFYEGYSQNLGAPARFYAYIPADSTTSNPDYFEADGIVYMPARLLPAESAGSFDSVVAGESGRTILLGFPRDQVPDSQYLEVFGYLYWDSTRMNPNPGAQGRYPVFAVESYDAVDPSAVRQPATRTYPEPPAAAAASRPLLAVRRGDLQIKVDRIEFAPDQTRVHVRVINLGTGPAASWDYARASLLTANGEVPTLTFVEGDNPATAPPSDILHSESLPAGGLLDPSVERQGYIFFGPVDASRDLTISLPDLNGSASASGAGEGDFMRLAIPARSAASGS